ncbi:MULTISPECIES: AAA family ATPase [unclassified Luteococcus]|uniref:AAA family ATPase n=1 Tax=unclassified Luteococcus TaxID=2639923 RepID=UPI00313EE263
MLPEPDDRGAQLLATLKTGEWLDAQVFPPISWAVPGLIPEGFGLFTGPPKAGKSWCSLAIGLAVAAGGKALGSIDVGDPRPVLLLALEDGDRRLQGRCRHLLDDGALPSMLTYQTSTPSGDVIPLIRAWLAKNGHLDPLIILDTLGRVMPPALPGEGAYARDYRIGAALKNLTDAHPGSCLLVVHHVRKATGDDWMDSTSGTNGLNGAADWTVNLSRQRNEDVGILRVTGRDVPEGEYAMRCSDGRWELDGEDLDHASQKASEVRTTAGIGDKSTEVLEYVVRSATPVTPKQVADALQLPDARRYMARLAESGRLRKVGYGTYTGVPPVPVSQLPTEVGQRDTWDTGTQTTNEPIASLVDWQANRNKDH